jgi:hypothetical protein
MNLQQKNKHSKVLEGVKAYYKALGFPAFLILKFLKKHKNDIEKIAEKYTLLGYTQAQIIERIKKHHLHNPRKNQRYDEASTLEEHFENFTGAVGEVAEDFLGIGKKKKARRAAAAAAAAAPVAAAAVSDENATEIPTKVTKFGAAIPSEVKNHAENQALQVNQLASMVQPSSKAVTPADVPTGSGTGGGESKEELYKTLPDAEQPTEQPTEAPTGDTAKGGTEEIPAPSLTAEIKGDDTNTTPVKSSSKKTGLYVIIVVVIGVIVYLKMKKKI